MRTKLFLLLSLLCVVQLKAVDYEVISPDNKLKIKLDIDGGTTYEVWHSETKLIASSAIALNLSDGMVIGAGTVKSTTTNSVNQDLSVLIGKNKKIKEAYNELIIEFDQSYSLLVRAYNEGVAYRFITQIDKEIIINREDAIFNFASLPTIYFPECDNNVSQESGNNGKKYDIHQGYRNFERTYNIYKTPALITNDKFSVTPVLFEYPNTPYKIVVTEADTYDYPGMYIERNKEGGVISMRGKWAGYPKSVMDPDDYYSNHLVYEREDYIAKTDGDRTFPWRVIIVSDDDKTLLNNELVYLLAEPCRLTDTSWIEPGKSAWEWWHKAVLEGVDFPVGNKNLSIEMYKYYIDWAAENEIEYMTLDAGYQESWVRDICKYGKEKGVKIIVWTWASCVSESPGDWVRKMKSYGVAGAKIDFFERNDQVAMRWGYEFAERLAASKMVGVFHGCPVPTGLSRTYPNILNFEAVRGAEDNFWRSIVTPDYHTQFPFIRALAGPMDYTPGSMRNVTKEEFRPLDLDNTVPMSMGTRAHELSMYVVFDQWMAYLCDAPTEYNKYTDILDFLSTVPAVWDKTVPLDAELGQYILIAKRSGADWYVGGMSNWSARTIDVDFSFLHPGVEYRALIIKDKSDSSEKPTEYVSELQTITSETKMIFDMAKGGGFVIRLINTDPSSIEDAGEINPTSVYVNSSFGVLQVTTDLSLLEAQIVDISGKCVLRNELQEEVRTQSIDISNLNKGIYIIQLKTEHGITCHKFIY